MNQNSVSNEPSMALQQLANDFIAGYPLSAQGREELLADWCKHLRYHAPDALELPVMQLIKAIVRANSQPDENTTNRAAATMRSPDRHMHLVEGPSRSRSHAGSGQFSA